METSPRFEICLPYTLIEEGGNSNDAHDPGGRTHKGIIQREYDAYRKRNGKALQSDYLMSDDEVRDIYFNEYWLPNCPAMPVGLDLQFFDNNVNEGPRRSIILLQRALKISDDGVLGPATAAAIGTVFEANPRDLLMRYYNARMAFYRGLSTFQYFGKGWTARADRILHASFDMLKP